MRRLPPEPVYTPLDKTSVNTRIGTAAKSLLAQIPTAETRAGAERAKRAFQTWCTKKGAHVDGIRVNQPSVATADEKAAA